MNKWQLYELLKGCIAIDKKVIGQVQSMDSGELREGIIEYLLSLLHNGTRSPPASS